MADRTDRADVRIFPPGVPLAMVIIGIGLEWLWPLGIPELLPFAVRVTAGSAIIAGSVLVLGLPAVIRFRRSGERKIRGNQPTISWKPVPTGSRAIRCICKW